MQLSPIPAPGPESQTGSPARLNVTPAFRDFFRAAFQRGAGQAPADALQATFSVEVRTLFIQWVQVLFRRDLTQPSWMVQGSGFTLQIQQTQVTTGAAPPRDPLVLDLDGSGPATTGEAGARGFDLEGDGDPRPTSFVAGGTALLALDRDGNGRIDSGSELFGDQHGAADGYEELRKFDANQDGRIDAADPVFAHLSLLFGDGRLCAIGEAGLRALSLGAVARPGSTRGGDAILRSATAERLDGSALHTYALALNRFAPVAQTPPKS